MTTFKTIAVVAVLLFVFFTFATGTPTRIILEQFSIHPANLCLEDENWDTVDHRDPAAIVWNNVSRRCVNIDESTN